jgi:hypothetical protein
VLSTGYKLCQLEGVAGSPGVLHSNVTKDLLNNYWSRAVVDHLVHQQLNTEVNVQGEFLSVHFPSA